MKIIFRVLAVMLLSLLLALSCIAAQVLIPGGEAVGLELELSGICITGLEEGQPAQQAGLRVGDSIVTVNRQRADSVQQLVEAIAAGKPVIVGIVRNEKEMTYTVYPQKTPSGWSIGAEIMERISGIGTVTYIDPQSGQFGALGHGVNVPNQLQLLPVTDGTVCDTQIVAVEKSESGDPGELKGGCSSCQIGTTEKNTASGLFGTLKLQGSMAQPIPVAAAEQLHTGDAVIRCTVNGSEVREYSVRIVELYPSARSGRDLMLEVTDSVLLAKTGGIVRGMSGSPIIQDGRLVGAVTHVIVDNPRRGYGILIENMLSAA